MKKIIPILTIALLLMNIISASAQSSAPYVIRSTQPISDELRGWLNAWLAAEPPSDAPYYIVTFSRTVNSLTYVSLVGVDLSSPDADWDLEEGGNAVRWMGSVTVSTSGTVTRLSMTQAQQAGGRLKGASVQPMREAGGGSYVSFPFQAGKAMIYGPRAVHGSGDYGTSGMLAVDLVSGDDLGAGAAPPYIYASDAGEIDYICDDGTSVAVRTHNTDTGDYFLYAHLLDNENLVVSNTFVRGALIGDLKYGSFSDDCGWAEQKDNHYHVHWMFVPSGGSFQAEGCVLSVSTKKWTCGTDEIGTGGWLKGGGGYSIGADSITGTAGTNADPGFFDFFLSGVISIYNRGFMRFMPPHNTFAQFDTIMYTLRLMIRIVKVVSYGNLNLEPLIIAIFYAIGMNFLMANLWLASFLFKAWKSLVPVIGA